MLVRTDFCCLLGLTLCFLGLTLRFLEIQDLMSFCLDLGRDLDENTTFDFDFDFVILEAFCFFL